MNKTTNQLKKLYYHERFPRASDYDPEWVIENEMGPNALWLCESLCQNLDLRPGMRVLDLGCGRALSSIFLAKEFGVQVWATDLWIVPTANYARICHAGLEDCVFPIYAEARSLPFAENFFDVIISLDSYHYYGTDVHYLEFFLLRLLKRGGSIGIISPASPRQVPVPAPDYLNKDWHWINSIEWWRHHWSRYPDLEVKVAELLPDGWDLWFHWQTLLHKSGRATRPEETEQELAVLEADQGRYLGFVRLVAERRAHHS